MARGDRFEWNMDGLIDLSNDVLAADCIPLAEQIADIARSNAPIGETRQYVESIRVESDKRISEDDFAHARVVTDSDHSAFVEARTGNLVRALNQVGK